MSTHAHLPIRTRFAAKAGVTTAALSRALGRGEGSVIGGRVSLAVDPRSLERLAAGRTVALVSGTNGKTTTSSMLAAALRSAGEVVTNAAGANMFGGMVSALSSSGASLAVLEVDEGHLPKAMALTHARLIVLLNLSRDQLDRVGEVRMQAQRWREAFTARDVLIVANCDDPMVTWAAKSGGKVVWVAAGSSWRDDATSCPNCGARIEWTDIDWACSGCDLRRPLPHAFLGPKKTSSTDLHVPVRSKLPGEVNIRNAAVAITAAALLGADPRDASRLVARLEGAGGRFTTVYIGGVPARLILAKNPAGWTEALRIARADASPVVVSINARVQDGRDPSWLWDVPFEQLKGRFVVATGDRGRDLSVRLHYGDIDHVFIENPVDALREAIFRSERDLDEVDLLANYSAFQDMRKQATS